MNKQSKHVSSKVREPNKGATKTLNINYTINGNENCEAYTEKNIIKSFGKKKNEEKFKWEKNKEVKSNSYKKRKTGESIGIIKSSNIKSCNINNSDVNNSNVTNSDVNNSDINNAHLYKNKNLNGSCLNSKNNNLSAYTFENSVDNVKPNLTNENEMHNNKTNTYINDKEESKIQETENVLITNNKQPFHQKKGKKNANIKSSCYNERMDNNNIEYTNIDDNKNNINITDYCKYSVSVEGDTNDDYKYSDNKNINYASSNEEAIGEDINLDIEIDNNMKKVNGSYFPSSSLKKYLNSEVINLNNAGGENFGDNPTSNNNNCVNNTNNNGNYGGGDNSGGSNKLNAKETNEDAKIKVDKDITHVNNSLNKNDSMNNTYRSGNKNYKEHENINGINKIVDAKKDVTLIEAIHIKSEDDQTSKEENEKNKKDLVNTSNDDSTSGDKENEVTNLNNNGAILLKSNSGCNISQNNEFNEIIKNIIQFNKNKTEQNLNKGEIYLNEGEYTFTSYLLLISGFRFHPCDEVKTKKRKEFSKLEELNDLKRSKSNNKEIEVKKEEKNAKEANVENHNNNGTSDSDRDDNDNDNNSNSSIHKVDLIEEDNVNKKTETIDSVKSDQEKDNVKEKEKSELIYEIYRNLKSYIYSNILNIENNFKNLDNKIEHNNSFSFNCIVEKLKYKNYSNILCIYNDIYSYLNNLFFLSKPSSYIWMKLHELSTQITNTIYNIQQKKEQVLDKEAQNSLTKEKPSEKSDDVISEEEKVKFQLILSKLHQDIHFELFRKFKSKAVWKTLEGGEIELDDNLTKSYIFRDMYNWCKAQLDLRNKKNDASESDSSRDSY